GVFGVVELVDDVRLGRRQAPRELEKPARGQILRTNHQHLAFEERAFNIFKQVRPREIDPSRLDAEPVAELGQLHPCSASSCFMREQASGGSDSSPAASASLNSSQKCSRWRADCWPPTITKWRWWPLSQAMKTTPVL